jgi:hypothetical protein
MPTRSEPESTPVVQSLRTLLSGLIDYAGLYPPAGLGMGAAAENYARYLRGEHAWMLGRFVCGASRLDELTREGAALMPGTFATSGYREHADTTEPWRVSVVADGTLAAALEQIERFNERHAQEDRGLAVADALEIKAPDAAFIEDALERIPDEVCPFFEVPGLTPAEGADPRGIIAALAGAPAAAKIRTGGITPGAFPTPAQVAAFIAACHAAEVPFKATAGLHHPVRAEQALTYERTAPRGVMHGFLNVFMAAALISEGADAMEAERIIAETDPAAFRFTEGSAMGRGRSIDSARLALIRENLALSFGSCSFEEPVDDLRGLGLLGA